MVRCSQIKEADDLIALGSEEKIKEAGKEVGHAVKEGAKAVKEGAKKGGKA